MANQSGLLHDDDVGRGAMGAAGLEYARNDRGPDQPCADTHGNLSRGSHVVEQRSSRDADAGALVAVSVLQRHRQQESLARLGRRDRGRPDQRAGSRHCVAVRPSSVRRVVRR